MIIAKFMRPDAAMYKTDIERAKKLLVVGQEYVVESAYVDSWHTDVYLKGFKPPFNSCHFDFFKDGEEIDIVNEFRYTFEEDNW